MGNQGCSSVHGVKQTPTVAKIRKITNELNRKIGRRFDIDVIREAVVQWRKHSQRDDNHISKYLDNRIRSYSRIIDGLEEVIRGLVLAKVNAFASAEYREIEAQEIEEDIVVQKKTLQKYLQKINLLKAMKNISLKEKDIEVIAFFEIFRLAENIGLSAGGRGRGKKNEILIFSMSVSGETDLGYIRRSHKQYKQLKAHPGVICPRHLKLVTPVISTD